MRQHISVSVLLMPHKTDPTERNSPESKLYNLQLSQLALSSFGVAGLFFKITPVLDTWIHSSDLFDALTMEIESVYSGESVCHPMADLPKLNDLPQSFVYPTVAQKFLDDSLPLKFSRIVVIGASTVKDILERIDALDTNSIVFELCLEYSVSYFKNLVNRLQKHPPDSVFIFFVDLFSFTNTTIYDSCKSSQCLNRMSVHSVPENVTVSEAIAQKWVQSKVSLVQHLLDNFKSLMPNQARVLVAPSMPHVALYYERDPPIFNHQLLHRQYEFENKLILNGNITKWNMLSDLMIEQMRTCFKNISDSEEATALSSVKEGTLVLTENPRFYEAKFRETSQQWSEDIIKAFTYLRDLRHKAVESPASNDQISFIKSLLEQQNILEVFKRPGYGELLKSKGNGPPCTIFINANVTLPREIIDKIAAVFDSESEHEIENGWLVRLPTLTRASIAVSVIKDFRVSGLVFDARFQDPNKQPQMVAFKNGQMFRNALWSEMKAINKFANSLFFEDMNRAADKAATEHVFEYVNPAATENDFVWDYVEGLDATMWYLMNEVTSANKRRKTQPSTHVADDERTAGKEVAKRVLVVTSPESAASLVLCLRNAMEERHLKPLSIVTRDSSSEQGGESFFFYYL